MQEGHSLTMKIVWNIAWYRSVYYYIIAYDVWLREYSLRYLPVLAWFTVDFLSCFPWSSIIDLPLLLSVGFRCYLLS